MTQAGRVCTCRGGPYPPPVFQPLPGLSPEAHSLEGTTWWVRSALEGRSWEVNRLRAGRGFKDGAPGMERKCQVPADGTQVGQAAATQGWTRAGDGPEKPRPGFGCPASTQSVSSEPTCLATS